MRTLKGIVVSLVLCSALLYLCTMIAPYVERPVHAQGTFGPAVCWNSTPISLTAAATLITAPSVPAGQAKPYIIICSINYGTGGTAETGSVVEGTTTTTPCDTGTAALIGGTTAATGGPIGASPVQVGGGVGWVLHTKTPGDNVCLLPSGASQVGGFVTWSSQTYY